MRAKSLKSSQILRAHMPYFRRPGHNYWPALKKVHISISSEASLQHIYVAAVMPHYGSTNPELFLCDNESVLPTNAMKCE